eukprot:CAMPEP_0177647722 /NCGR_PEP_ID=MMETSP0447-20121125/10452_1 /TAXON_ID=0 /ORGANISM="Stygamoeba regulata, Strain BSH-02190019" /LENGTH=216 /DNA_ID=CAMNT_0019150327 /DNA_START=178 /DNA_END=828 /DNA_ORIENTATION=-
MASTHSVSLRFVLLVAVVLVGLGVCAHAVTVYGNGPERAIELVREIVPTYLPFLEPFTIEVVQWNSQGGYFLRSSPKLTTVTRQPLDRVYQVFVNPIVFNDTSAPPHGPSLTACRSILTHELTHCSDYANMTVLQLAEFVVPYELNYTFLVEYEHYTDRRVLDLRSASLDAGLSDYRTWIYGQLADDPEQLAKKKVEYMTPDQIHRYVIAHPPTRP